MLEKTTHGTEGGEMTVKTFVTDWPVLVAGIERYWLCSSRVLRQADFRESRKSLLGTGPWP